ncbi:ABA4-like family protein [Tabrizicola sp. BL-A-41-H6]|uniref:ABA4-like family protein n=1 Tax=Tabrizicola sp. BL-A-41-H6 TaxID=3421107 RepID=UPI003D670F9F
MTPDALFQLANPLVLVGWGALLLSPLAPVWADRVASLLIPLLLSVAYAALVLSFWSGAPGGFGSLPEVMALFTTPGVALAGWLHYLAFDLFVGAWITRTARAEGIAHAFVIPCLALTFLFGPAGFLAFHILRATRALTEKVPA